MPLINNTIVFLDTAFFKEHRTNDKLYADFFRYAQEYKIALCASHITLEEWRTQKLKMHNNYVRDLEQKRNYNINQNFITDEILSRIPLIEYPDDAATEETSIAAVQEFTRTNKIMNFAPLPVHTERTWFGYFRGLPPFNMIKRRDDIPDAWIFEVARDLKDNPTYRKQQNRFCIGSDKAFKEHLEKLGLV